MPESGSSGHLLLVLAWASLASGNFRCQLFRVHLKSGSSTEDDLFLQLGDEPRPRAVFRGLYFECVFERRSAPSDQRHAVASAFLSLTLIFFRLERDQQKFDDRAVVHLCRKLVTASFATMRPRAWPEGRWRSRRPP